MSSLPTFADVRPPPAASRRRARTPLLGMRGAGRAARRPAASQGGMLQRTGSFKFRGAYNVARLDARPTAGGVVAFSSGNHAQGVARPARLLGMPATIVMPADAPRASSRARARSAPRSCSTIACKRGSRGDRRASIADGARRRARAALRRPAGSSPARARWASRSPSRRARSGRRWTRRCPLPRWRARRRHCAALKALAPAVAIHTGRTRGLRRHRALAPAGST